MRHELTAVVLTLTCAAACASRSDMPAQRDPGVADTPGAEAAAQIAPQDYEGFMKQIGTTYPSMQANLMAGSTSAAADEAQQLARWFGQIERFWAQHEQPGAVKLAQTARTYASDTAGAATAGDLAMATRAAANLQGTCKQCHGTYREMDPAGGFRIKPDLLD